MRCKSLFVSACNKFLNHTIFCSKSHLLQIASSLGGRCKKGRGGGEKHKRGEREGSACYKSRCFCNPPTIFSTNPIMSLSIRDQSQVRGFSAWSELNYFVYRKLSSWDAFFKWYHNRVKWNIFTVLAPAANTTNRLRPVSHFFTARSLRQTTGA